MNLWPTAADLVGLPGLPGTRRGIQLVGDREGWVRRTEPVRGGQVIRYAVESLPAVTRLALAARPWLRRMTVRAVGLRGVPLDKGFGC